MSEFFGCLFDHVYIYLATLLSTFGVIYLLFRKHFFSIFDPLLYYLIVGEGCCIADVLFMYYYGIIEVQYFVNYLLTETAFFAGILLFKPAFPKPSTSALYPIPRPLTALYHVSLILFVGFNILVYAQRGIPLFAENRLDIYRVGGGWGLVTRVFDVLLVVIVYYLMEVFQRRNWRFTEWAALCTVLVIQVLTGAKNAVLIVVFIVCFHAIFTGARAKAVAGAMRFLRWMTVTAVGSFLLIMAIQRSDALFAGKELSVPGQAMLRFVMNGDAFLYAYPNGFIERLDDSNPSGALLGDYLAFFRFAAPEELPVHLGAQIAQSFNGRDSTNQTNAKHNIFGYVYFGAVGSVFFSLFVGVCIGFVRYGLLGTSTKNWVCGIAYVILNLGFMSAQNDWPAASRAIIGTVVLFLPFALWLNHNETHPSGGLRGEARCPSRFRWYHGH